jgi:outer membrane autotransporter protein
LHAGAGKNVTATSGYLNDLLIAGTASGGLMTVVQNLTQADGYVNEAAMNTLHPEAYAVAAQIGIDNGLSISSALRASQRAGGADKSRFFMLGQGLGSWQNLRGNSGQGISNVQQSSGGLLGGIGYQAGPVAVAAVVGRIYANQSLSALGARTKADGTFLGASASFERGGLDLGGSVVWDGSSATTHRTLFDRTETTGDYDLHSLTFDAHGGYGFAIGKGGWRLGPELGVTHIRVKRGDAHEIGNDVLALVVAGRKQDATFVSADLRLDMAVQAPIRPWLTAGWRYRASGDATLATAGFPDTSSQFTVAGAERDRNYAQVGGGFDWSATPGITLFARGNTAVTGANGVTNITGGIRLGF